MQQLLRELENGNDVALVATLKIGKSGLIQHCFDTFNLEKDYNLFFIDFYTTGTLREMVYMLSRSIVNTLAPKGTIWLQRFSAAVRSLSFVMTTDLAGIPKLNLQLGDIREPFVTLEEIFYYLEHSEKPNIVAIDEFQQIAKYPEKNVEALLRTYIQNCHNTKFIFRTFTCVQTFIWRYLSAHIVPKRYPCLSINSWTWTSPQPARHSPIFMTVIP